MSTENIFEEADEIIEQLDDNLVSVETQPDDLELINTTFVVFTQLKGWVDSLDSRNSSTSLMNRKTCWISYGIRN